ncbi:MAG: zinc-binding dehydrogenase, partial [Rivularia sp. (in: cyanobacteria)]
IETTMKAIVIEEFGTPSVLKQAEIPTPSAGDGEVLIEVKASSVNPVDWKIRNGFGAFLCPSFPSVLHPDCSGVVAQIGNGVSNFQVGDEVWSFASGIMGKQGALAEYMPAEIRMVAKKPKSLSFEDAATLPLVSVTAWLCLLERTKIEPGSNVLIQGGTGGVGFIALQIAKEKLNVNLYATCGSDEKCRIAEDLGAKKAFNYKTITVEEMVDYATGGKGFDVVFNTPGALSINASVEACCFGGTILDINNSFPTKGNFQGKQLGFLSVFAGYPIVNGFNQAKVGEILTEISQMVDAGKIRPLIDERRFTYAQIQAAHDYQENGKLIGKVALKATW